MASFLGVTITDPDGTTHHYTMQEAIDMGFTAEELTTGTARPAEKNEKTGYSPVRLSGDFDASVSLDKDTGKITVKAPSLALQNDSFKKNMSETLKTLNANYKMNPDYKYNIVDETGENKEKSIQDIIDDMNAEIKTPEGKYNTSSIKYMAMAAAGIESQKIAYKQKVGIDFNDNEIMRINTVAVGPDIKSNTLQLISDLPEAQWLRNVGTYDASTGTAQYGDIMENAYNKEKTSSEDMVKLIAALEEYFAKGNFSNKEEYIKNVATMRFLDATQPNMAWIRDVTENVRGFLDGIGGFATELGTAGLVAIEHLGNAIFGIPDDYYDYYGSDFGDISVVRGGSQYATDMPREKVDAKIGRVRIDADGVPVYTVEDIEGSIAKPRTTGEYLRAVFKENQAVIRKDMEYLHASQASWDMVGYALTEMAALISAGNMLSDMFTVGAGALTSKVAAVAGKTVSTVNDLTYTARALYASGTALGYGATAAEAAQIINGMKTIYDIAAATGKAATFLNFIGRAVASSEITEFIIGVVGESVAEAVVGDPNRLVEVLNNNEIDGDTKTYLISTYVGNAVGWGVGLGIGETLIKAGETTRGRAISANLSRRIFKVQNSVGEAFDRAILTIRRVKGDTLADQIETLYKKGTKYSQKQANSLTATMLLRNARAKIIETTDPVKIIGKSTDEINDALKDVEKKILDLKKMEISLNSMQRQGTDIVQGWLKDKGAGLKEATENFYTKAGKVSELEKAAGDLFKPTKGVVTDLSKGKTLHLFSQTTTNYIKASEKMDFIAAYIAKYEHAAGVTQDVLKKIDDYKKELPVLQGMVKTFVDNATPELKLAADNFIDADRKWWAKFEDLRAKLGLTDLDELNWYRGSNLWGTNGELYARTTRKSDLSEYVVKHRDGASNVKTFDSYEQYMAGATGDFADPMGEMQLALYDAGNKQAYRSFTKSYDTLTGSLMTKITGEETALFQKMKKGLRSAYFDSSERFMKGMVEDVAKKGGVQDVIKNLKLKTEQLKDINRTKKAMNTAAEKMQAKLNAVTAENAGTYIHCLNAEDTTDLWNEFYNVSLDELLTDGEEFVPNKTRKYIMSQARELGIEADKSTKTITVYEMVNKALSGTADTPDAMFENKVKRSILSSNENVLNDTRVQSYLSEQRKIAYEASMETFLAERTWEYNQLSEEFGITTEALNAASRDVSEGYIDDMIRKGTPQRNAIDELCKFYDLENDPTAIRYFALSAFVDNKDAYKAKLYDQIRDLVKKEHGNFSDKENDKIAKILTNGIASGIEEEFHDAYLIVKEMNPAAVHEDTEKIFKDVDRIAKELEEAESNRYAGEKNIIAMRNMQGKVEYYQTDPLLARLVNFQYSSQKLNGMTQAIYNANYLWTKLFRLGTTAINLKSMVSQSFRDPLNMFIGGGAYRFGRQHIDEMVDVFGDDIVNWYKINEPEALARLQKQSVETGESIQALAVKREVELGQAISPAATETSMYKSLNTAKQARFNGVEDIYDDTTGDKIVRGIDKFENTLGKPNEWRETTLRNISYTNGFSTALKRGYSIDEARTFATFVMNEATTNFTRMTSHLVSLKDTVPYFGSAINGSKSFFKLLSMDPVGVVGRLTGGLIIPAIALTVYSLNDEENRKIYQSIPEYQKEDALTFVVGGQIFSIPIPQELSSFVAPFRQTVESMYGVSTNTFAQLAWNDILGFSPLELSGFADLDFAKLEQSSPGFLDRIGKGVAKLWAQLAPPPLKSGLEIVTGVDPYTGKEIDKTYLDYDEDGNPIVKDYKSGELAKAINNMFRSWGWETSAPVIQNILSNIFGQASVDITDFLVSLATQVPTRGWAFGATEKELSSGEVYNPLYTLEQRLTSPVLVDAYDEAQSAWKTEVTKLYNMKAEILRSDAWSEYVKAKSSTDDPDKLKNINASKKNLVEDYFDTIKNVVNNLQANYGEEFTAAKYATVLSLMTMDEQTLDLGTYGKYLEKEKFKTARAQAIQTMINLGFPSSSDTDILGKFVTDSDGNVGVKTYSPLAILQLDDKSGAALNTQSNKQHYVVIRNLLSDGGAYDLRDKFYDERSAAYDEKDYDKVEELTNKYNEKIIKMVGPYIEQYSAESVLRGDALDYLKEYMFVPSEAMGEGKYWKSSEGVGANKQDAFRTNYVKAIFGYGENKLNGNR